MLGFKLVSERYLELLEKELERSRTREQAERNRADRLNDQLLAMHGSMPVTELGLNELEEQKLEQVEANERHQSEMVELFSDSIEEHGDIAVSEDIKQEMDEFVAKYTK